MSDGEKVVHVVDDDDSVRRSVGFMLKTSGYRVCSYASGTEILKDAKCLEPGCVLLDIRNAPGVVTRAAQRRETSSSTASPFVAPQDLPPRTTNYLFGIVRDEVAVGEHDALEVPREDALHARAHLILVTPAEAVLGRRARLPARRIPATRR